MNGELEGKGSGTEMEGADGEENELKNEDEARDGSMVAAMVAEWKDLACEPKRNERPVGVEEWWLTTEW